MRKSARAGHYAITQREDNMVTRPARVAQWHRSDPELQARGTRYDLAQRDNGKIRAYYGVTEDGIQDSCHHAWRVLLNMNDETSYLCAV